MLQLMPQLSKYLQREILVAAVQWAPWTCESRLGKPTAWHDIPQCHNICPSSHFKWGRGRDAEL